MRCGTLAILVVASIVTTGMAAAQSRDDNWERCNDFRISPDASIEACTAIIQSSQETTKGLVTAFLNRGIAVTLRRGPSCDL